MMMMLKLNQFKEGFFGGNYDIVYCIIIVMVLYILHNYTELMFYITVERLL